MHFDSEWRYWKYLIILQFIARIKKINTYFSVLIDKMKILTEDLLREYGFMDDPVKSSTKVKIMTRNDFDVSIKVDGMYYSNLGFDYPLKDTATLRKVYKEVKNVELKLSL